MFIILSIYSKNTNSLTNFLKFFYKLDKKKILRLNLYAKQFQKKKSFSFVSALQSPHVNKKSQEQFEFNVHNKQLKIQVYQLNKFLFIWKWVKTKLFLDVRVKFNFLLNKNLNFHIASKKINYERFISCGLSKRKLFKKSKKEVLCMRNITRQTFFKLIDIQGEKLLKLTSADIKYNRTSLAIRNELEYDDE